MNWFEALTGTIPGSEWKCAFLLPARRATRVDPLVALRKSRLNMARSYTRSTIGGLEVLLQVVDSTVGQSFDWGQDCAPARP
jgi:hypothetical protein